MKERKGAALLVLFGLLGFGCQASEAKPKGTEPPKVSENVAKADDPPKDGGPSEGPERIPVRLNARTGFDVRSEGGVVTSVEKQASEVGTRILLAGGNAVDAAVGVAFALAVTHPSAGNIGGGGFALVRFAGRVEAYDFRENAPLGLNQAKFRALLEAGGSGPLSVGVPGTVSGLLLLHEKHGVLSRAEILEPARKLAEDGFVVGPRQSKTILWSQRALGKDDASRKLFLARGKPPLPGARLKNPNLAKTLRLIADRGRAGFYQGEVADDLVRSTNGALTLEDLKNYEAKERVPLTGSFQGFRIFTMPPASGGGLVLLEALRLLDRDDFAGAELGSPLYLHFIAEALRRGHVDRRLAVRAPELDNDGGATLAKLLSPERWSAFPLDPQKKTPSSALDRRFTAADRELEHTTHFSVIDRKGNLVSCTVTLSASFGAKLTTRATGIVLNNSVGSFSSVGENLPRPGVRTVSSMTPTLVLGAADDALVLGSPGGDTIPGTVLQTLLPLLRQRTLREAVDTPRLHQGFVPDVLSLEAGIPDAVVSALRKRGHQLERRPPIGDANIALFSNGVAFAVADGREGGAARASLPTTEGKTP